MLETAAGGYAADAATMVMVTVLVATTAGSDLGTEVAGGAVLASDAGHGLRHSDDGLGAIGAMTSGELGLRGDRGDQGEASNQCHGGGCNISCVGHPVASSDDDRVLQANADAVD